jgi:hypothetical protein
MILKTIHMHERFFGDKYGFLAIRPVLRTVLWDVRFLNCPGNIAQLTGIE